MDEAVRAGRLTWCEAADIRARVRQVHAQIGSVTHDVVPHSVSRDVAQFGARLSARTTANIASQLPSDYGSQTVRAARRAMTTTATVWALRDATRASGIFRSAHLGHEVLAHSRWQTIDPEVLDRLHEALERANSRRLREANWWLPNRVDPSLPSWIRGLEEALPTGRRRSVDECNHSLEQWRVLLRYRYRRARDSPGRLVTTRCRVPRGPNFRRLPSLSRQSAGPVVRA